MDQATGKITVNAWLLDKENGQLFEVTTCSCNVPY